MLSFSTLFALGLVILNQQPQTEGVVVYYFLLIVLKESLFQPPVCRTSMSEFASEAQNDEKILYYMYAILDILECIATSVIFYLVGYLIGESTKTLT